MVHAFGISSAIVFGKLTVVLAARTVVEIDDDDIRACAQRRFGRGEAGRPGADDRYLGHDELRVWEVTASPLCARRRHSRTSVSPLTVARHSKQEPMAQNRPRGRPA